MPAAPSTSRHFVPRRSTTFSAPDTTAPSAHFSIAALAASEQFGVYHLINPNRMRYSDLLHQLNEEGTPLEIVSTDTYLENALASSQSPDHPLYTIMPILKQKSWFSVNSYRFDMAHTLKRLEGHGIQWPNASELQKTYAKRLLLQKRRFGNNTNIKTH